MTTRDENRNKISLPFDVVMEIIRRVRPPKSLVKLQLVCKEWQTSIRGPRFGVEYHKAGALVDNYNCTPKSGSEPPPELSYRTLCSLNGFVLLMNNYDSKVFLWNPTICQVLELPNPHAGSYGFALSYVVPNRNYILLSVYKDKDSGKEACEVINLSNVSRAWTRLLSFPDPNWIIAVKGGVETKPVELVMSGEEVHCIRSFKCGMTFCIEVVTVDTGNESCTATLVPQGSFHDWTTVKALDWNRKLGIANIVGANLHVLVLEDYKKRKWSGNTKVIPLPFVKKEKCEEGSLIPLFAENGNIRFWLKDKEVFTYNVDNGLITHKRYLQEGADPDSYSLYKESIIHLDGMQPAGPAFQRLRSVYVKDSTG